jgi:hypothetical protein
MRERERERERETRDDRIDFNLDSIGAITRENVAHVV